MTYDKNLRAAVAALIKAKGRHHTGIEYARLVEAFNAKSIPDIVMAQCCIDVFSPITKPDPRYHARCALQDCTAGKVTHEQAKSLQQASLLVEHAREKMELEIAKRSETISDTRNMTRFDSSMTREQIADKIHRAGMTSVRYDALQDKTDWSAA
jgi:hypothetical protein